MKKTFVLHEAWPWRKVLTPTLLVELLLPELDRAKQLDVQGGGRIRQVLVSTPKQGRREVAGIRYKSQVLGTAENGVNPEVRAVDHSPKCRPDVCSISAFYRRRQQNSKICCTPSDLGNVLTHRY